MMDNGKIKVSVLDGIPLVEVYHDGELQLADVEWINYVLFHEMDPTLRLPIDVIIDKKGKYSLSVEALKHMERLMKDANRVAYVVYSGTQEAMIQFARNFYLSGKQVESFSSVSEAYAWLKRKRTGTAG